MSEEKASGMYLGHTSRPEDHSDCVSMAEYYILREELQTWKNRALRTEKESEALRDSRKLERFVRENLEKSGHVYWQHSLTAVLCWCHRPSDSIEVPK